MISNTILDMEIKNPFGETMLNNPFSYYSEDNWDFLNRVNNKEIPMFSQAYSILANTMEQFYKGIYVELKKMHPEMPSATDYELGGHHFDCFIKRITRVIPVSGSKEGVYKILDTAERIQRGYTDAKYHKKYEYVDFGTDFRRYEVQRERLYKALDLERQKYETRGVLDEKADEDDDLKYYK